MNLFQYKCCGTVEYTDWDETEYGDIKNRVPDSCCKQITEGCGENVFTDDNKVGKGR